MTCWKSFRGITKINYLLLNYIMIFTNKRGIAIVESVVFLSILWTIGFISLQWYSWEAKNAKRISDLSNIKAAISIKIAQGYFLDSFITETEINRLSNLSLGWKKATNNTYRAWIPNYQSLDINRSDFIDPNWNDYPLASTPTWGWRFLIAASLEENYGKVSLLKWNYQARRSIDLNIESIDGNFLTLEEKYKDLLSTGDRVTIEWKTYNVLKDSFHSMRITLDWEVSANAKYITLSETEGESLISDFRDNSVSVLNNSSTAFPY